RHAIDRPMTRGASDAFPNVDAVVEIHEIRKVVHARPFERPPAAEAGADRLKERARGKDLRVAVHTGLRRGDSGEWRLLDRRMAEPAGDAVATDVTFVAELDGLLAGDVRLGDPGRSVDLVEEAEKGRDSEQRAEDADLGNCVGAAVEDLHEAPASG